MVPDKSLNQTPGLDIGQDALQGFPAGYFQWLDALRELIVVLDPGYKIHFINKAYAEHFAVAPSVLKGQSLDIAYGAGVFETCLPHLKAAAQGVTLPFSVAFPGLADQDFQVSCHALRSGSGDSCHFHLVIQPTAVSRPSSDELMKSHARYKALIDQSDEGIWRFELDQPIAIDRSTQEQIDHILAHSYLAECNDAMARMYGFERGSDLVGIRLNQMFVEGDESNLRMLRTFIEANYRLPEVETVETDREGRILHFRNNLIGFTENGFLVRGWGSQKNISAEVQTREAMQQSERRLRMASEAGRVGIWEWDIASGELFWSDRVKDIYGFARDQQPSMKEYRAAIHPEDRAESQARVEKALSNPDGETYTTEHRILCRGVEKWVYGTGEVVFDEQRRPIRMSGTVIDITARKHAEIKSIQLNELGRALSKAITTQEVAAIISRFAVEILSADAFAVYEMREQRLEIIDSHGYPAETLQYLSSLHARSNLPFADAGFQGRPLFLGRHEDLLAAYPHLCPQGGMPRRSLCGIPLMLHEKVMGVMGLSFNTARLFETEDQRFILTFADQCAQALERARLYDTERNARMDAEAANRAKSRFLANMSHEIRTPLGAILGFTELMNEPNVSEEERAECIETILRNGQLLNKVINDILDLSKIESERLEIEHIDFDLVPLVEEVIGLLSLKAREKSLKLELKASPDLPRRIHSDPTRLRQILVNLISNAIKFTPQGSVVVAIEMVYSGGGQRLEFSVTDTGVGVSPAEAERIFEPFVQADSSTTRKFGGTGLGLSVSRSLARALGGDLILAYSEPGSGSRFTFTIATPAVDARSKASPRPPAAQPGKELSGIRVLLIDDGADNLLLISRFLVGAGAEVQTGTNGLQGVDLALSGDFDIVVMDIQMPGMDGLTAIRHLHKKGYTIPCVALTAYAMKGDREECVRAGFVDHLVKPLDRLALIRSVKTHARRR